MDYDSDGVGLRLTGVGTDPSNNALPSSPDVTTNYDLNGNLTRLGTTNYTWNALNQLTQVSGSDGGSFTYDVLGRRTQRQLAGIGTQPTQWNNPWDRGGPLNGISDLRGSSLATQSVSNGTLALGFAPYGEASAQDANGQPVALTPQNLSNAQWAGMQVDTQSLYYAQNRYYNPQIGRFISEDPASFLGGFNPYGYCSGDPVNFVDPMGLFRVYLGGTADYPFLEWDNATLSNGFETGRHAAVAGMTFGWYDGGAYKCQEGFGTSKLLGSAGAISGALAGLYAVGTSAAVDAAFGSILTQGANAARGIAAAAGTAGAIVTKILPRRAENPQPPGDPNDLFYRSHRTKDALETVASLGGQAVAAEKGGFGYGVSVAKQPDPLYDYGVATRQQITDAGFKVISTPARVPNHHTVLLPEVDQIVVDLFNNLFDYPGARQ